jgi:hypothetical protein
LVEAKANIPEIVTFSLGAKSEALVALIKASLDETKSYLNSRSEAPFFINTAIA